MDEQAGFLPRCRFLSRPLHQPHKLVLDSDASRNTAAVADAVWVMIISSDLEGLPGIYGEPSISDDRLTSQLWSNLFISETNRNIRASALTIRSSINAGKDDHVDSHASKTNRSSEFVPGADKLPTSREHDAKTTRENLAITVISSIEEVKHYLSFTNHVRAFFIRKMNSSRPLGVPESMFQAMCHGMEMPARLEDYVLFMGKRETQMKSNDCEMEIAFPPASVITTGKTNDESHRLHLLCGLRYADLNDNESPEWLLDKWSLRQSVICGVHKTKSQITSWLFVSISRISEQRLSQLWSYGDLESLLWPFRVVFCIFEVYITNWRFYLADFAAEIGTHQGQVSGTLPDGSGPLQYATAQLRLRLLELDSRLFATRLALQATRADLTAIGSACEESNIYFPSHLAEHQQSLVTAFTSLGRDVDVHLLRVDHLQAKLQSITSLVSNYLELENGLVLQRLAQDSKLENEAMRGLNQEMRDMAENNARDSAKITVLTILTLVYLPLTVVSNFFSTSFVGLSQSGHGIFLTDDWWLLLVTSVPLTIVTLYVWWIWSGVRTDRSYPFWWPSKYRRTKAEAIGRAWQDQPTGQFSRPLERAGTFDERDNYSAASPESRREPV